MNLNVIVKIASCEAKMLRRSWLLRFFAFLVFVGITLLQIEAQSTWSVTEHHMTALSSSIPFFNIYWFNLIQSILLVFIVADRFKSEKYADTLESIRVRPMNNLEYLAGKMLGIFTVFVVLNIISLLIALFINIFASNSSVDVWIYFFYLLTLTVPSCLFLLGLTFLLYSWIKNSILALLASMVFLVVIYAFTPSVGYGIFDFFAREIPNVFSEMTGHVGLWPYLLQRLTYLVLGLGLLGFAAALYPRVANHGKGKLELYSGGVVLLGVLIGGFFVGSKEADDSFRAEMIKTFEKYSTKDRAYMSDAALIFEQSGSTMSVKSELTVQNRNERPLSEILLFLNPALKITAISGENGESIAYRRDKQIVVVEKSLEPGKEITLRVDYAGKIDDRVCYLDIPNEEYHNNRWVTGIFCFGKQYSFLSKAYTLLEPEVLWYPVAEPPVDWAHPYSTSKNYTSYTLNVIRKDKRTVISQGKKRISGDTVCFENSSKLMGISLCMGDYTRKSVTVDSVLLDVYFYHGENYFLTPYASIVDTIPSLLLESKDILERPWGHSYLYDRLTIMETPVSFATYMRGWSRRSNYVQPAMVFIPEQGVTIPEIVNLMAKEINRVMRRRKTNMPENQDPNSEYHTMNSFLNGVMNVFREPVSEFVKVDFDLLRGKLDATGDPIVEKATESNKHILISLFQDNRCAVVSKVIPIAGQIFDQFQILNTSANVTTNAANENPENIKRVLDYLMTHSLEDAANDPTLSSDMFKLILLKKCVYLQELITMDVSPEQLEAFMSSFLEKYRYQQVSLEQFMQEFEEQLDYNLSETFNTWYKSKGCSFYLVKDIEIYKVEKGNYSGYMVSLKVYNPGKIDLLMTDWISANFMKGARGYWIKRFILPAGDAREIRVLCADVPGIVSLHAHLALNEPADMRYMIHEEIDRVIDDSTQGVFPISPDCFQPDPNEVIVDNEDEGFSLYDSNGKRLSVNRDKRDTGYEGMKGGNRWTYSISPGFYGQCVKSVYYKKSGDGKAMAEWKANLSKPGKYEVFIYSVGKGDATVGESDDSGLTLHYTLYNGDEKEEIEFMPRNKFLEWVSVGTFSFEAGETKMVMNDKANWDIVYVDAVKWVFVGDE